jgi:hypothetical protein
MEPSEARSIDFMEESETKRKRAGKGGKNRSLMNFEENTKLNSRY